MRRALVLVEGITDKPGYIEDIVKASPIASNYDEIKRAKTEEFFDKKTPWYLKPFSKIDAVDKFADMKVFLKSHQGRVGACRTVRFLIQRLQRDGYEVDVLSHSLGTIITLVCGPNLRNEAVVVKRLMLYASPLGLAIPPLRAEIENFTRRYLRNFYTEEEQKYVYGTEDLVSKVYREESVGQILDLIRGKEETKKEIKAVKAGHSLSNLIHY